jgi:hypothetical protein
MGGTTAVGSNEGTVVVSDLTIRLPVVLDLIVDDVDEKSIMMYKSSNNP